MADIDALLARAKSIREDILRMTTEAGSGHPSSSLSATEIVTALYFGGFLRHDPKNPHWPDRDRFILSKGHAAPVLYAALAQSGYFPHDEIMTLRKIGSPVEGHPNMKRLPGVEASTGSLGQGLSIGIGHALAARVDKKGYHTYVMTGDGELGEGQNWEAAASAAKYQLDNLTLIVDRNHFQQTGPAEEVLNMDPIDGKFTAFGWKTQVINGNDMREVAQGPRPGQRRQGHAHLHRLADPQGPGHPQPAPQAGRHQFPRQAGAAQVPRRGPRRGRRGWRVGEWRVASHVRRQHGRNESRTDH